MDIAPESAQVNTGAELMAQETRKPDFVDSTNIFLERNSNSEIGASRRSMKSTPQHREALRPHDCYTERAEAADECFTGHGYFLRICWLGVIMAPND